MNIKKGKVLSAFVFITGILILVALYEGDLKYFINIPRSDSNYSSAHYDWIEQYQKILQNRYTSDYFYDRKASNIRQCASFPHDFRQNVNIIMHYKFNVSEQLLQSLDLDSVGITKLSQLKVESAVPVVVTAASANHFLESQSLIRDIHTKLMPKYNDLKLVYYDIGLKPSQLTLLRKHCRCEVRTFPFDKYPEHVRILKGCTWKPIILQTMLQEFPFVMWLDASITFNENSLDPLFSEALQTGIKIRIGSGSIAVRTHPNTFKALGEDPCMFNHPELPAGWILIKRNKFTLYGIMKPWVSCSLQYGCMTYSNYKALWSCPAVKNKRKYFGSCHRFDQSVIGIILLRLFSTNIQHIIFNASKYGFIRGGKPSKYFEVLDSKYISI